MKLKPCPLCLDSERNNFTVYFHDNYEMEDQYKAGCGSCGCSTPVFKTQKEASLFWNTRIEKRTDCNCPLCNNPVDISEYKISKEQIDPFFQYVCTGCGFSSGISKNKKSVIQSWNSLND